jgi:hypothetical protein
MTDKQKIEDFFHRLDKREVHVAVGDYSVLFENMDDCNKIGKLMNGYKKIQVVLDMQGFIHGVWAIFSALKQDYTFFFFDGEGLVKINKGEQYSFLPK